VPTYQRSPRFKQDWKQLTPADQQLFKEALKEFIKGVPTGQFPSQLGVKQFKRKRDVWEMSWGKNRRATFSYGEEQKPGERHIIWRRIGTHAIYHDA
jgi:hypothetical protein